MTRRYRDGVALRAALDTRLKLVAERTNRNPNWLRRRIAFARLLCRLAEQQPDIWVLKGGMAVETRRPGMARSTSDIDLILRPGLIVDNTDERQLRDAIAAALLIDPDQDGFEFAIRGGSRLRDDAYGRPAWRFPITTMLAGRLFAAFKMDVVARPEEVEGGVERRELPDVLGFAGVPTRSMLVADLRQQYAEKLHALTRSYLTGESTRVKDLVDLVLLIEDGVAPDAALLNRVRHVFVLRRAHDMPAELGVPPGSWGDPFRVMAEEIGLAVTDHRRAHDLVVAHWERARRSTS